MGKNSGFWKINCRKIAEQNEFHFYNKLTSKLVDYGKIKHRIRQNQERRKPCRYDKTGIGKDTETHPDTGHFG